MKASDDFRFPNRKRVLFMKKAISLLLSLLLFCCALPAAAGAAAAPLRFAVASDLHYNVPEKTLTFYTADPLFGHANRRAAMENESGFIIDAFLADCEKRRPDCVLISGDLADNGKTAPQEHFAVRDKLLAFEKRSGVPVFVINGNHDVGENCAVGVNEFKEIYKDLGYDKALTVREGDCSYTADLGESCRLIALDSCDPSVSTADGMTADRVLWVLEQVKAAKAAGRYPVLMMHHNLLDHLPAQRILSRSFIIKAHLTTAGLFADAGVRLALTGHEHCSDAAGFTSAAGSRIFDFATTSLTMYPLAYRLFTLTADQIRYEAVNVENINVNALSAAVRGYPRAVLAAMKKDLTAFSKSFLKKGVQYRLTLQLDAEKSGLKQGGAAYSLLEAVYAKLRSLLEMPLYGEGSAAALAQAYNIGIPATPYETGWDLATEFVAAHYAGGESFELTGPEITALLRLVSLALKNVPESAVRALLGEAAETLGGEGLRDARALARRALGGIRPDEVFAAALVSDLVYGFTSDDAVNDNSGVLAGYAQTNRPAALAGKGMDALRRALRALRNFFAVLFNQ